MYFDKKLRHGQQSNLYIHHGDTVGHWSVWIIYNIHYMSTHVTADTTFWWRWNIRPIFRWARIMLISYINLIFIKSNLIGASNKMLILQCCIAKERKSKCYDRQSRMSLLRLLPRGWHLGVRSPLYARGHPNYIIIL